MLGEFSFHIITMVVLRDFTDTNTELLLVRKIHYDLARRIAVRLENVLLIFSLAYSKYKCTYYVIQCWVLLHPPGYKQYQ